MYLEKIMYLIWGSVILIGVLLGAYVNRYWLLLDVLIGVNFIQMAFTGFCLTAKILHLLGVKNKEEYEKGK